MITMTITRTTGRWPLGSTGVICVLLLTILLAASPATAQEDGAGDMATDGEGEMPDDGGDPGAPEGGTNGETPHTGEGGINDIVLTDMRFSDEYPMEGDVIMVTITLRNVGLVTAGDVHIMFFEGGVDGGGGFHDEDEGGAQQISVADLNEIGNVTGLTVRPGENVNVSIEWMAEKYDHTISAMRVVEATPLQSTTVSEDITVTAEPMGDIPFLVWTLAAILSMVFVAAMAPSVLGAVRNGGT